MKKSDIKIGMQVRVKVISPRALKKRYWWSLEMHHLVGKVGVVINCVDSEVKVKFSDRIHDWWWLRLSDIEPLETDSQTHAEPKKTDPARYNAGNIFKLKGRNQYYIMTISNIERQECVLTNLMTGNIFSILPIYQSIDVDEFNSMRAYSKIEFVYDSIKDMPIKVLHSLTKEFK